MQNIDIRFETKQMIQKKNHTSRINTLGYFYVKRMFKKLIYYSYFYSGIMFKLSPCFKVYCQQKYCNYFKLETALRALTDNEIKYVVLCRHSH